MEEAVSIKGIKNRLFIKLSDDLSPGNVVQIIDDKLSQESVDCWKNSTLILNTGMINLSHENLKEIKKLFEDKYKMYFSELQSLSEDTRILGKKMGWTVSSGITSEQMSARSDISKRDTPSDFSAEKRNFITDYIKRTVRNGNRIDSSGNVVVLGDVNRGSEIYAVGDIIVFGTLRGAVFAGIRGDESRVIVALKMQPVQIGIGKCFSRAPDAKEQDVAHPEIARIENGHIVIESFKMI